MKIDLSNQFIEQVDKILDEAQPMQNKQKISLIKIKALFTK
jgi:hypothetical protein